MFQLRLRHRQDVPHLDLDAGETAGKRRRKAESWRIDIAPHDFNGRDVPQLLQDRQRADVAAVQNHFHSFQQFRQARIKESVCI